MPEDVAAAAFVFAEEHPRAGSLHWVMTPELVDRRLFWDGELAAARHLALSLLPEPVDGSLELVATCGARPGAGVDRGVFVSVQDPAEDRDPRALDEVRRWYREVHVPDLLGVHGVTGCWWFEGADRAIRLYWLDDDPVAFHEDLRARTPHMAMVDRATLHRAYRSVLFGSFRRVVSDTGPSTLVNHR